MKKLLAICICVLAVTVLLCACSGKKTEGGSATESKQAAADNGEKVSENPNSGFVDSSLRDSSYKSPAEAVTVDSTAQNPSNDDINFVFDEVEGKIVKYTYKVDGKEVMIVYTYKPDNKVEVYGFMGETLVANEIIDLPGEYDKNVGITTYKGYYFKGYKF